MPDKTVSWVVFENKILNIALQKQPIFLTNVEVIRQANDSPLTKELHDLGVLDNFSDLIVLYNFLMFIFGLFQTNNTVLTTNQCEKMSCPSSIWRWDSNPQPLDRESSPITTRTGQTALFVLILALKNLKLRGR